MTDIVWEDPPDRVRGTPRPSKWNLVVEELKRHPGKWALVATGGEHPGSHGNRAARLRSLGCEKVQRRQPDGSFALYERWPES